jgi:hypothetical protein
MKSDAVFFVDFLIEDPKTGGMERCKLALLEVTGRYKKRPVQLGRGGWTIV